MQIVKARNFLPIDSDNTPDTYVKCYIKDGERLKYKKKTRVVRHSMEPIYKQCLKYQVRCRLHLPLAFVLARFNLFLLATISGNGGLRTYSGYHGVAEGGRIRSQPGHRWRGDQFGGFVFARSNLRLVPVTAH